MQKTLINLNKHKHLISVAPMMDWTDYAYIAGYQAFIRTLYVPGGIIG